MEAGGEDRSAVGGTELQTPKCPAPSLLAEGPLCDTFAMGPALLMLLRKVLALFFKNSSVLGRKTNGTSSPGPLVLAALSYVQFLAKLSVS